VAAGLRAGVAFVELVPKIGEGFESAVAKDLEGPLSRVGSKLSSTGATMTKAITLPIVAGVAAIGGGLLAAGAQIDDALDNLSIKTGESGKALEGLQDVFRTVAANVPDDFGRVSDAVAELHARTGLTGTSLQGLSEQVLTLSRLTGGDLSTTIEESTRLFGDWGVGVDDQEAVMDRLYLTTQKTGVGFDGLSTLLVQFGGPLRQLGFSLDESAALIAKFQKEGVNTELVLGSMRVALGKMAKAGEAPAETLRRVMDEIKNAGSAGEANAKALELFGARAGPDMAAAIREGRFSIDELLASTSDFEGSIRHSAAETDGFAETFGKLRNHVLLAVEPIATKLFAALDGLVPKLEPVIEWIGKAIEGFTNLDPKWQLLIAGIVAALAVAGPLVSVIGAIVGGVGLLLSPVALVIAGIAALVVGLVLAYQHFEGFRDVVNGVVSWLVTTIPPLVQAFVDGVVGVVSTFVAWWQAIWPAVSEAVGHVVAVISAIVDAWVATFLALWHAFGDEILAYVGIVFDTIKTIIETVIGVVKGIIETALALIKGDWGAAWNAILGIFSTVWDGIKALLGDALAYVGVILEAALSALRLLWDTAWSAIAAVLSAAWEGIKSAVSSSIGAVVDFFTKLPGRILGGLGDLVGLLVQKGKDLIVGLVTGYVGAAEDVWAFFTGLPGKILGLVGDWTSKLKTLGVDLVKGIIKGIESMAGAIGDAVTGLLKKLPGGGLVSGALSHVPGLATGGTFSGMAVVGEKGPELAFSASRTRVAATNDLAAMIDEAMAGLTLDVVQTVGDGSSSSSSTPAGPLLEIGEATFVDPVDLDELVGTLAFAADSGRFD
jgi:TP901 family phage tail tape measure protein